MISKNYILKQRNASVLLTQNYLSMKKRNFYLIILAILLLASCSSENSDWKKAKTQDDVQAYEQFLSKHPKSLLKDSASMKTMELSVKCPIVVGPYGSQILISLESAKKICNNRIKIVNTVEKSRNPIITRDYFGNTYEQTKNDSTILISTSRSIWVRHGNVIQKENNYESILRLKGTGKNSYWLGTTDNINEFYTVDYISDQTSNQIADQIIGYKKYVMLSKDHYVKMTKGTSQNDYYAGIDDDNKIYKVKADDGVEQIGNSSYFWISDENKPRFQRTILMTKGMNTNDKWCGELDGTIYIFK